MAFRQQVRSKEWQQQLLSQPLAARRTLAKQLRDQSQTINALKAEDIMDVTPQEVINLMSEHNCLRLIHGHTHRPNRHQLTVNDKSAERIVLGDWCQQAWFIQADQNTLKLENFSL
jgi:UDP-2,3-diacylglucosamine hydrolase